MFCFLPLSLMCGKSGDGVGTGLHVINEIPKISSCVINLTSFSKLLPDPDLYLILVPIPKAFTCVT